MVAAVLLIDEFGKLEHSCGFGSLKALQTAILKFSLAARLFCAS